MKLRNKETGGLANLEGLHVHTDAGQHDYSSLAELNEDWEDYEELKGEKETLDWLERLQDYYYIDDAGCVRQDYWKNTTDEDTRGRANIGNIFKTKEEAEKAVEKLKAWKRLKDAGFEFKGWKVLDHDSPRIYFNVYRKNSDDIVPLLDLLFGGEE